MDDETAQPADQEFGKGCLKLVLMTLFAIGAAAALGYVADWLL